MGFRQGAFARIWSVNDEGKYSTANISISKKNKETGKYDVEFSDGYTRLVGSAHEDAKGLGLPSREEFDPQSDKGVSIKISSCDVTNHYDTKTKKLYTNCTIFGFEIPDNNGGSTERNGNASRNVAKTTGKAKSAGRERTENDNELPF